VQVQAAAAVVRHISARSGNDGLHRWLAGLPHKGYGGLRDWLSEPREFGPEGVVARRRSSCLAFEDSRDEFSRPHDVQHKYLAV
jgi:hypothetical protein